jgi:SAM-dependent methyltransferase
MSDDRSNGYEAIAPIYIRGRGSDPQTVGASIVAAWSRRLPDGAAILDLGCGPGVPISQALIDRGFTVYGVDASPSMVAAFHKNFPSMQVQCAAVEDSDFFGHTFDAVVSWGLFFLLTPEVQRALIAKVGAALLPGGRFLFTSPPEVCSWNDAMTQKLSVSLGESAYRELLKHAGMSMEGTDRDAGQSYYYFAVKR